MAYSYREPRGPLRASFFNLPRGTTGYVLTLLEQIKDGLMYVGKYRSKQREIGPTHVVVFANQPPPEGFVSEDRLRVRYIKREDPPEDEPVFTRDHAQEEDAPLLASSSPVQEEALPGPSTDQTTTDVEEEDMAEEAVLEEE